MKRLKLVLLLFSGATFLVAAYFYFSGAADRYLDRARASEMKVHATAVRMGQRAHFAAWGRYSGVSVL